MRCKTYCKAIFNCRELRATKLVLLLFRVILDCIHHSFKGHINDFVTERQILYSYFVLFFGNKYGNSTVTILPGSTVAIDYTAESFILYLNQKKTGDVC